jgi:hypothetical protein
MFEIFLYKFQIYIAEKVLLVLHQRWSSDLDAAMFCNM